MVNKRLRCLRKMNMSNSKILKESSAYRDSNINVKINRKIPAVFQSLKKL